ncbi:MAG: PilN domain-containing protein [Longimicrobiales bacterium]
MIEINLLPGSVKRTKRKGISLPTGKLTSMKLPKLDRVLAASIGMTLLGVLLLLYMQVGGSRRLKAATDGEMALQRDTLRLSVEIAKTASLQAKQDTIKAKLTVIQQLDGGRYNWAHIMDEIGRAVPDYTWLVSIMPAERDADVPAFKIEGRMGNAFALPKFIQDLESSPFIANVALRGSDPLIENKKPLYGFVIEAQYEEPPVDMIRTEPLFGPGMAQPDSAITSAPAKTPVKQPAPAAKKAGGE